jgi:hypothetical protein
MLFNAKAKKYTDLFNLKKLYKGIKIKIFGISATMNKFHP